MSGPTIRAGIALEGEKEFRSAITGINKDLNVLKSEMNANKEVFAGQANSLAALTTKHTSLGKILETQKQKVAQVTSALEASQRNYEKAGDKVEELKKAHEDAVKAMDEMKESSDATTEEIEAQEREVARLAKELEKSEDTYTRAGNKVKDWETSLNRANKEVAQTDNALKKNAEYMREAGTSADKTATSIDEFGKKTKGASEGISKTEQAIGALGQALVAAGIAKGLKETIEALKECANASIEFESAITGVYKTVDGTDAQLKAISDGIKEMSTVIPASTTELAGVAEAAGQLGIKTEDVLKFTEVMTNLGVTTNLTAEDAAQKIAKFANIVGTSAEDYERLGSVIVAMGNNFATTEADVTNMATNLASAGKLAGMSESNIVALSTAMSSVGIQAEAGGTAMTQTFTAMEKAVASGAEELDEFARISGMSSEQFADAWENDAITAVQAFISGLGDLGDKGESATLVLDEMGLSGIRQAGMLKSLALASGVLTESISTADVAWQENTALTEEAALRYGTLESKQQLLGNSVNLLKIAIGDELTPAISGVVEAGTGIIDWATDFIRRNPWVVSAVTGLTTALGLLAGGLGALMIAEKVNKVMKALNVTLLANPYILVAAAIAGVVVALGSLAASGAIATSESQQLLAETRNLNKEARELKETLAEQKEAFSENIESTQAQYAAYQSMTDRLYELDDALRSGTLTEKEANASKIEMEALVNQLNSAMPELNLEIDKQNGLLVQGKQATDDYILSMQKKAKQAVIEKDMTELYEKQYRAEMKLTEATLAKHEAQDLANKSTEEATTAGTNYNGMMHEQLSASELAVRAAENAEKEYGEALDEIKTQITDQVAVIEELNKAEEEAAEKTAELGEQSGLTAAEIAEATEAIRKRYEEMYKSIQSSVSNSISAFDEFSGGQKISSAEMQKNLDGQIAGLKAWKDNMLTLSKATGQGMTSELMDELISMGPEGANAVNELVKSLEANNGSFEQLAKTWTEALNLKDPIAEELTGASAEVDNATSQMAETITETFSDVAATVGNSFEPIPGTIRDTLEQAAAQTAEILANQDGARASGAKTGEAYASGIADGVDGGAGNVNKASEEVAKGASGVIAKSSGDYTNNGRNLMVATAQGMQGASGNVAQSARNVASNAVSATSGYEAQFNAVGYNMSAGLARGIGSGASLAITAAQNVAGQSLKAAQVTLEIKSPSRKFEKEVGKWIPIGIAKGITNNSKYAKAAASDVANATIKAATEKLTTLKKKYTVSMQQEASYWRKVASATKQGSAAYKAAMDKYLTVLNRQEKAFNHKTAMGKVSIQGEIDFWKKYIKAAQKGSDEYKKGLENQRDAKLKLQATNFETQKELNNKTINDEIKYLKKRSKNYKKGSEEYLQIQAQMKMLKAELERSNLDHQLAMNQATTADEIKYWEKRKKATKKGSEAYKEAVAQIYTLKVEQEKSNLDHQSKMNQTTIDDEIEYWEKREKEAKKGSVAYKEAQAEIYTLQWKQKENQLNYMTALNQITISDEITFWKEYLKTTKKGGEEWQRVSAVIYELEQKQKIDAFNRDKDMGKKTLKQEAEFWEDMAKTYKKGSDAYNDATMKAYNVRKALNESLADLEKTYAESVKNTQEKLVSDVKNLTEQYNSAVASRSDSIMKSMNLFSEFTSETENDGDKLLHNLATQVVGLENWTDTLAQLERRGLKGALLEELQEMGVSASADLEALNSLTDKQLSDYVKLWEEKTRLAKQQATKENTGLLADTNVEIKKLTSDANAIIKEATAEFNAGAKELGLSVSKNIITVTAGAVSAASTSLASSGKAMIDSLIDGIKAKNDELARAFDEMTRQAEAKAKALAGIINSSEFSAYSAGVINAVNHATPTSSVGTTNQTVNVGGITIHVQSMDMDNIDEIMQAINEGLGAMVG